MAASKKTVVPAETRGTLNSINKLEISWRPGSHFAGLTDKVSIRRWGFVAPWFAGHQCFENRR